MSKIEEAIKDLIENPKELKAHSDRCVCCKRWLEKIYKLKDLLKFEPEPTEFDTTIEREFVREKSALIDTPDEPKWLSLCLAKIVLACGEIDRLTADLIYASKVSYQQFKNLSAEIDRLTAENNKLTEWVSREICDLIDEKDLEIDRLTAKNKRLENNIMEHGEALLVLSKLRKLYNLSPDMLEPTTESAAKMMMREAEEGLRLAHQRNQEDYIKKLLVEIDRLTEELKAKDEALQIILRNIKAGAVTVYWIEEYIEQALKNSQSTIENSKSEDG